jgi:catalase
MAARRDADIPMSTTARSSTRSKATKQPTPEQMVNALHVAFGEHRARAVHAKGVLAEGDFVPSREATALSTSLLFGAGRKRALVRFSDFTGIPNIADTVPTASPRGFAVKFDLPGGATTDVVAHSFDGFPVATTAEFRELLTAIGTSGPGARTPTPLDKFLAAHPTAKTFLTTQKPAPVSYATLTYFGVNAFRFTNAAGGQLYVRYRFVPVGGEKFVEASRLSAEQPDYLSKELPTRLAYGPAVLEWCAQIAEPGDRIDDPSVAWPAARRMITLGTIRVVRMVANAGDVDRRTVFDPANVTDGIEPADPMVIARRDAYALSFQQRQ